MPKLVRKPHRFKSAGRRESLDWSAISDGRIWRLVNGDDFSGDPRSIQSAAHSAAKRRGMQASTEITPEGDLLVRFKGAANAH